MRALLAIAFAVSIVLAGPLLLFNPWSVSFEQARNDVPARLSATQAEIDRVTAGMLCDLLLGCDDFAERLHGSTPLLTDEEGSHMRDVAQLVRILWLVLIAGLATAGGAAFALRHERRRVGMVLVWTGVVTGCLAILVGAFFAVAFDQAFLVFHQIFFPQGNFLFGPDSNLLRLFPEGFWFEASLTAGLLIVLSALATALAGWRLARSDSPAA